MLVSRNSSTQQSSASFSGRLDFVFGTSPSPGDFDQEAGEITKTRMFVKSISKAGAHYPGTRTTVPTGSGVLGFFTSGLIRKMSPQ